MTQIYADKAGKESCSWERILAPGIFTPPLARRFSFLIGGYLVAIGCFSLKCPKIILMNASIDNRDEETFAVIGAAMRVHTTLGHGFLEAVYQEALAVEFRQSGILFEREKRFPIRYRGVLLNCFYQADFLCFGKIIVEVKAIEKIGGKEESQAINYLKASGTERALLLNFGAERLQYKRMVFHLCPSATSAD